MPNINVFDLVLLNGPAVSEDIAIVEFSGNTLLTDNPYRQGKLATGSAVTFDSAVLGRNTIVVFIRWQSATITLDQVSDTLGNTYVNYQTVTVASAARAALYIAADVVAGTPTISASFSSPPSGVVMAAHEVKGRDLLDPVDDSAGQAQLFPSGTDGVSSGPMVINANGTYLFGATTDAGFNSLVGAGTTFFQRLWEAPSQFGVTTEDRLHDTGVASVTFTYAADATITLAAALQPARMWLPSLSEAVTVTESVSISLGPLAVVFDALTVEDAVSVVFSLVRLDVSDAVAVTESTPMNVADQGITISVFDAVILEGALPPVIVAVDAVAVTELVILRVQGFQVSDTVTVTESQTVKVTIRINVFDVVLLVLVPDVFESVTLTESVTVLFATSGARQINVNDAVVLAEFVAVPRFHPMLIPVNEAVTVTEQPLMLRNQVIVNVSDAVTVFDEPTTAFIEHVRKDVSDAVAVSENILLTLATAGQVVIVATDSILVEESVALGGTHLNATVFDAVTLVEAVTVKTAQLKMDVNDAVTVTDVPSLAAGALGGINVSDAVTLTEHVFGALSFLRVEAHTDVSVGEGRELTQNPMHVEAASLVAVSDDGTPLVGERIPTPRIRGIFAWERWIRRDE